MVLHCSKKDLLGCTLYLLCDQTTAILSCLAVFVECTLCPKKGGGYVWTRPQIHTAQMEHLSSLASVGPSGMGGGDGLHLVLEDQSRCIDWVHLVLYCAVSMQLQYVMFIKPSMDPPPHRLVTSEMRVNSAFQDESRSWSLSHSSQHKGSMPSVSPHSMSNTGLIAPANMGRNNYLRPFPLPPSALFRSYSDAFTTWQNKWSIQWNIAV
jgi:hypothetical protein